MKCPFWHTLERRTEPRFDSAGKKIGEEVSFELRHEDCQKGACQIYDTESKLCSLPDADKKQARMLETLTTALPARLKSDFDASLFEKAEMLSVVFSSSVTHLQDALKGYHAQLAKNLEQLLKETNGNQAEVVKRLKESGEQEKTLCQTLTKISAQLETIAQWAGKIDTISKRGEVLEKVLVDVVTFLTKPKK
jgi:hypothetical protein